MGSLAYLETYQRPLAEEVHPLASLGVCLADSSDGGVIVENRAKSLLVVEVKEKQYNDTLLVQLKEGIHKHKTTAFSLGMDDGTLRYQGRLCVPNMDGLQEIIMTEAHTSRYSVHPVSTKMYHDLKEVYWWNDMKMNIADFVGSWDDYLPLIEFSYNNNNYHASIQMASFETLYGRICRSPIGLFEIGEAELIGTDVMHQAMEKFKIIKERLKTARSHHKSYSDVCRRDLEFKEDDWDVLEGFPHEGYNAVR
ncbi:uncharacterized protein [Nicotiana tomentosiformis]|uniref:uncharacterized protein n=1 Tax=Nicotiana tomentosiformis TaxID=4098 RepID=UPI00388C82C6